MSSDELKGEGTRVPDHNHGERRMGMSFVVGARLPVEASVIVALPQIHVSSHDYRNVPILSLVADFGRACCGYQD